MTIAYLRVSTDKQHLENQRDEILKFAIRKKLEIDRWHTETVSGTVGQNNRLLANAIRKLGKGDVIIVSEISRLSRKMLEIMAILNTCIEKEIVLYCIKEGFCFSNNINSKIMGFAFGMSAEIERNLISARTKEALAYRKAQGVTLGRPKGSSSKLAMLQNNTQAIRKLIDQGISITLIAKKYQVARGTLYAFLKTQNHNKSMMI